MRPNPMRESGHATIRAPRDPTVPGAKGEYPQPNQVAKSQAGLVFFIRVAIGERGRGGDDVLFHGPVAEVDFFAALAAEGGGGILQVDWFLANRTTHEADSIPC